MKRINLYDETILTRVEKTQHYYGAMSQIAEKFGAQKLGFHIEVIDPKNFSCPYHYHEQEEELFIVIEGEAIVRCNEKYTKVKAGDLFFYPTGSAYAHNMYNHTDKPFKFIGISNNSDAYDVCHYPDSAKVSSEEGFMQNNVKVGYYKDEENPAAYWPEHVLRGEVE